MNNFYSDYLEAVYGRVGFKEWNDKEEVPRHKEIDERLARGIIKKWGL